MGNAAERGLQLSAITAPASAGNKAMVESTRTLGLLARPLTPSVRIIFDQAAQAAPILDDDRRQANQDLLAAIADVYGLRDREIPPSVFFNTHIERAHNRINVLLDKFCPVEAKAHGLIYSGPLPDSPATLIEMLNSPQTTEKNRYALRRLAGIAILSGQTEAMSDGAKERIEDMQAVITSTLSGKKPEDTTMYSLHDNNTNEILWTHNSPKPRRDKIANSHLKEHEMQTWNIDGIGPVEIKRRIKPDPNSKALRKAITRAHEGEPDVLDPLTDVPDIAGLQFVVLEETLSSGKKVKLLMENVKKAIIAHFGTEVRIEDKNTRKGEKPHQSRDFDFQRLMVYFPDLNVPIELMFHGLNGHLNNTYDIGTRHEQNGKSNGNGSGSGKPDRVHMKDHKPNGPAHDITDVERDIAVLEALFDKRVYKSFPWDSVKERSYARVELELKSTKRVPLEHQTTLLRKLGLI